jgi:pRiA4b ORF-3-like protein
VSLPESLPSSGTPGLAALAAKSAVLRRAASLAGWAGGGKRTLTAKGVLRKQDVPAAAAIIGVKAPQAVRSAADLPELHVAWCAAIGMGLLTVEGGKASGGPELKSWPPDDGTGLLEAWLKGFFAVSAVLGGGDLNLGRDFLVLVLALLKVLQDEDAPAGRGLLREVLEEADEICDSRGLDADVHGALSGLSSHGMPRIEGLTALLADFGIIAKARPTASKAPAVTPLGEWAASCLAEVCPVPLDAGRASGHPEAEQVASSVEAFAASGAQLTIRQGVQLKVALKYAKPPVWRSVQLPLTATLGDLHAAIQALFGWDGDHLHEFHAGGVRYSDPFYELEGTEDEEDARLRDAFPPCGPKITYAYDFGADWVHEITRQKVITLQPGQDYPVCVAFGGNSPVEYPSGDEPEEPEPFDQAAVNTALAGILRS